MNDGHDKWARLAHAARVSGAAEPPLHRQPGWWPELQSRIRPLFIRLLWRRWALGAALVAAALLLAGLLFTDRRDDSSGTNPPTLTIPQVP